METSLNERDGVIDPHARLIARHHRLDEIAAGSSILLAKRKRRRQHLARMKRLAADVGVVQVKRADEDAIDEQRAFYARRSRITDHRGSVAVSERLANGCFGDVCGHGAYGSEGAPECIEKNALGRGDDVGGQILIADGKGELGKFLLKGRLLAIAVAGG